MAESERSCLMTVLKRTQSHPRPCRFDIELVLAVSMNVSEPNGPQMGQVFFLHRIALRLNGLQSSLHVDGVPHDDRVRQEIEASRLVGLTVLILLTHHPFAGKEEKLRRS